MKPRSSETEPVVEESFEAVALARGRVGVRRWRSHEATVHAVPLVLLHGFTGSSQSWRLIAKMLSRRREVYALDLPGHGATDVAIAPDTCGFEALAEILDDAFERLSLDRIVLGGYSLGGRIALYYALGGSEVISSASDGPAHAVGNEALAPPRSTAAGCAHRADRARRLAALVLESASFGIEHTAERAARREADEELAQYVLREGVERFVERWERMPVLETQRSLSPRRVAELRRIRLSCTAAGLASSLRWHGMGRMPFLGRRLSELRVPVFAVAGAEDPKYARLAQQLCARARNAQCFIVRRAGHSVHLESPEELVSSIEESLERIGSSDRSHGGDPTMIPDWRYSGDYEDIRYGKADGIARISINRPQVRNAFRPKTILELIQAFADAREDPEIGVVVLTGEGPLAFCSGGDQGVRGDQGYVGGDGVPRLNVLDLQKMIRSLPKPVVAMVAGYAIGGGHVLHLVCDLTIAADNAVFGQTGPKVGSFDGGFGAGYLARVVGQKKAREIWFLCRQYGAREALDMGLVNAVVPLDDLERTTVDWCKQMLRHSPMALRCLKSAFNAETDGMTGIQELAGNTTLLFYMSEEAQEGRNAFNERRAPDFSRFRRLP